MINTMAKRLLIAIALLAWPISALAQTANLTITKNGPATVTAGTDISCSLTAASPAGPQGSNPPNTLTDTLPAGTTFVSETHNAGQGWNCIAPSVGNSGTITCTNNNPMPPGQSSNFTFVFHVNTSVSDGTILTNTATISHTGPDPDLSNNSSSTSATVSNPPALSGMKSVSG